MKSNMLTLEGASLPEDLQRLSSPPRQLFCRGAPLVDLLQRPRVAIVGSRSVTPYGQQVASELARELANQGVVIISGLALGVDSIAHQAALEAEGRTIAVLPGPVDSIYPVTNTALAERLVVHGGTLVSEYAERPSF